MRGVDAALDALAERAQALALEADDLAGELRGYGEGIEAAPGRLDEVEERLAQFDRPQAQARRHDRGGARARARVPRSGATSSRAPRRRSRRARGALEAARGVLAERAAALHDARARPPARALADAVRERLAELAMEGASFEVGLSPREAPGPTGADEVEFLIAPNPGVPAGPLRETASGGELSRVMLALMGVAGGGRRRDAGLRRGRRRHRRPDRARGRRAAARRSPQGRQVICITHLPQIASLADRHFTIVKDASGETARTTVTELDRRRRRRRARAHARRRRDRRRGPPPRKGAAACGLTRLCIRHPV